MRFTAAIAAASLTAALCCGCATSRPLEALGLVHQGDAALVKGEHEEAAKSYRAAIREDEESYEAWIGLGSALARGAVSRASEGDLEAARVFAKDSADAFRSAVRMKPDGSEGYAGLGAAYGFLGEPERAYAVFSRLEEKHPESPRVHEALAIVLTDLERYADAMPHFELAMRGEPTDPEVYLKLGDTLIATGRHDLALGAYRRFHDLAPGDARFLLAVAETLVAVGDAHGALEAYEKIEEELPALRDRARLRIGDVLLALGDHDGAERAFRLGLEAVKSKELEWDPDLRERTTALRLGLARAQLGADRRDVAIDTLRALLADAPEQRDALALLGGIMLRAERYDEAIGVLEKLVELAPTSGRGHFLLADALAMSKRYTRASKAYERAISLSPDSSALLNNFAWLLVTAEDPKLEDCDRALAIAERAVMLSASRSPESLDTLAEAYRCLGRHADALRTIKKAIHVSPDDALFYERREEYEAASAGGR